MSHKVILQQQQQDHRIVAISVWMQQKRIEEEQYRLLKLQRECPDYLNLYDQLFRLVTLWLLEQGFDLTNHQPHQVLKVICRLYCPTLSIDLMVQHRHQLKKGFIRQVAVSELQTLQQCHDILQKVLQAYDLP